MGVKLNSFDVVDFLKTDEHIDEYLNAAVEEKDAKFLCIALGDIVRAKNFTQLSKDTELSQEVIDEALSGEGDPAFATIFKIISALGLQIKFSSHH